jgi:hypothetical protein
MPCHAAVLTGYSPASLMAGAQHRCPTAAAGAIKACQDAYLHYCCTDRRYGSIRGGLDCIVVVAAVKQCAVISLLLLWHGRISSVIAQFAGDVE